MARKSLEVFLLILGILVPLGWCQHWSYGLNPGGKRELDSLSDSLGSSTVEGFPHMDTTCRILIRAEESPFPKIYRMKGAL
ncbi:progonadoliberin-1-like isoform X2 [Thalassophryne amazonica]|uniref:progonadoliberin-1-like isoform X2 n=1 Tax=Thalassophryne amazonica TaxID=390379 RepID=UPI001470A8D8|nr:progonadoliberin-1-like isoform X2 [Thalassophryne amazonica]